MITDGFLILSGTATDSGITGQAVTGTNTSVTSTNVIDLQVARDLGKGAALEIVIEVVTAASGGTSVQFQLVEADDAGISTNVQVIVQTDAIAVATLAAGVQVPLHWDRVDPYSARRYIALRYQLVGTVAAGAYYASVNVNVPDKQVNYTSGFVVL